MLRGPRVTLRRPRADDKDARLAAGRDPEFHGLVGATDPDPGPLTQAEVDRWYASLDAEQYGWVIEHGGRAVGTVRLHGVDHAMGQASFAIGIFRPEDRSHGLGTEATRLALSFAFGSLRLTRVVLRVLALNTRAIACYERCGFVREAVEPEGALLDGRWEPDLIMRVGAGEFREAPA